MNKEIIAFCHGHKTQVHVSDKKAGSIETEFKRTFNIDNISRDLESYLVRHLYNWIQDKISLEVSSVRMLNLDRHTTMLYPN